MKVAVILRLLTRKLSADRAAGLRMLRKDGTAVEVQVQRKARQSDAGRMLVEVIHELGGAGA